MKGRTNWLDVLKKSTRTEPEEAPKSGTETITVPADEFSETLIQPTDKADKSPEDDPPDCPADQIVELRSALGPEGCKLRATGWKPIERCGRTIWKSPLNGFWYSQEMADHVLCIVEATLHNEEL